MGGHERRSPYRVRRSQGIVGLPDTPTGMSAGYAPSTGSGQALVAPTPLSRRVMHIVCLPVEEGGKGQIRATEVTIEPDIQIQGRQLSGYPALQTPQAASTRKV